MEYRKLLLLILLIIHIYQIKRIKSLNYWKQKNKKIIKLCRIYLKEVYDLIETPNKFLIGGTLLGSVRNNDIIPFDDDIDIGIYVTKEEEISNIKKQLRTSSSKYNYKYKDMFFGCKLIKNYIGVDIFFYKPARNNKVVYASKIAQKIWPNEYYYRDELINLKKSYILNNKYNITNSPSKHLNRAHGDNWKTTYITHTHTLDLDNFNFSNFTIENLMNTYLIFILKILNYNRVK